MGDGSAGLFGHQPAAVYVRRRLLVLCSGLAVLAVAAWGLSMLVSAGDTVLRAAIGGHGAGGSVGLTGSGPGRAGTGSTGAASSPASTGSAQAQPASTMTARPLGPHAVKPKYCSWRNIVLSVFTGQPTFPAKQLPSFSVDVVSTAPGACSFNLGSKYLALIIKEGPVTVWNSADCAHGTGTQLVTALQGGVPTTLEVTWNRQTSAPGCSGPVNNVPPGSYTAYAQQGRLASRPVSFRLG